MCNGSGFDEMLVKWTVAFVCETDIPVFSVSVSRSGQRGKGGVAAHEQQDIRTYLTTITPQRIRVAHDQYHSQDGEAHSEVCAGSVYTGPTMRYTLDDQFTKGDKTLNK